MRKIIIPLFLLLLTISSCKVEQTYDALQGETMGTYYKISFQGVDGVDKSSLHTVVDSLLALVNDQMSTYIDTSFIAEFNKSAVLNIPTPEHFKTVFGKAEDIYKFSEGRFDPTVMPLANFWGFGYTGKVAREQWDSTEVQAIVDIVGMDKISLENGVLIKKHELVKLDFSALAKGYAADLIAEHMEKMGYENYLIDIGGDGLAKGTSKTGNYWRFGINTPDPKSALSDIFIALEINGKGLATSGNYRNFYEVDGEMYGHTINAETGFPYKSNVLSASIIAPTAMEADALATACMASDLKQGIEMIENRPEVEAYLIYEDEEGNMKQKYTSGFKDYILE